MLINLLRRLCINSKSKRVASAEARDDIISSDSLISKRNKAPRKFSISSPAHVEKQIDTSGKIYCREERNITFDSVSIRHYEVILGDHPDCSDDGPPLSIGWTYHKETKMSVDSKEEARVCERRAKNVGLVTLSSAERMTRLRTVGYSEDEIQRVIEESRIVQQMRRRNKSINNGFNSYKKKKKGRKRKKY